MPRQDCVTTVGLQRMASHLANAPLVTHVAFGDDDTAAQVSDIALANETHRDTIDSISNVNVSVISAITIAADDIGSGEQTIDEVGVLDGSNLLCRHALYTPVKITGVQQLTVVYEVVLGTIE